MTAEVRRTYEHLLSRSIIPPIKPLNDARCHASSRLAVEGAPSVRVVPARPVASTLPPRKSSKRVLRLPLTHRLIGTSGATLGEVATRSR